MPIPVNLYKYIFIFCIKSSVIKHKTKWLNYGAFVLHICITVDYFTHFVFLTYFNEFYNNFILFLFKWTTFII